MNTKLIQECYDTEKHVHYIMGHFAFVFSCKCTMIPSSETCSLSLNNTVKATIFVWALLM